MTFRISVDTGGTFTDAVVRDSSGTLHLGKAPTTPDRIFTGIKEAIAMAGRELNLEAGAILGNASIFIYGTTTATNAILEGRTAKTAFLVTQGFPDILVLREGGRADAFNFHEFYPDPYIPRRLTFEITERVDAQGGILTPLDEEQARLTIRHLRRLHVQAVAVCLLWSIANPSHEDTLERIIQEELPGIPYTLSHRLNPIVREYRRASGTAIDASMKPLVQQHLEQMEKDLAGAGFGGQLLVMTSVGGALQTEDAIEKPIYLAKSGPSLAPVAGRLYTQLDGWNGDVIVCDTGGTSFDVSLIGGGEIRLARDTWLGGQFVGHMTGMASVDVRSIGAGGGSIAWLDAGGLLRVGPRSAGAEPGPACYGKGGSEPTVTDAALVLGYIDPEYFLSGRIRLNAEAARAVMELFGEQLGRSAEDTAIAILAVGNESMIRAIEAITIREGVDPRECMILAGGGAAGLNILPIAQELGSTRVLVPRTAGALSASGGQFSDVMAEFDAAFYAHSDEFPSSGVNRVLEQLNAQATAFASRLDESDLTSCEVAFSTEARYAFENWEIEIPLEISTFRNESDLKRLEATFHEYHEQLYATKEEGQYIECLSWKARLRAILKGSGPPPPSTKNANELCPVGTRRAVFQSHGELEVPIYRGDDLEAGHVVEHPAIIEEATSTLVVYPGWRVRVEAFGFYLLEPVEPLRH